MARLRSSAGLVTRAADLPSEEQDYSVSGRSSADDSDEGSADDEEDGNGDAELLHSGDSASDQLLLEHIAALQPEASQHFSESTVDNDLRSSAVELANLLNTARQQAAATRNTRTNNTLPVRPTRASKVPEITPQLKAVSGIQDPPPSTGKLRKPTHTAGQLSKLKERGRKDPFEPSISPSEASPEPLNKNIITAAIPEKAKRNKRAVDQSDALIESSPPSRKSRRIAGEDTSVEPVAPGEIVEKVVQKRQEEKDKQSHVDDDEEAQPQPPTKRRGRPSKVKSADEISARTEEIMDKSAPVRRGRPPKSNSSPKATTLRRPTREQNARNKGPKEAARTVTGSNTAILAAETLFRTGNAEAQKRESASKDARTQRDQSMEGVEQIDYAMNQEPDELAAYDLTIPPAPDSGYTTSGRQRKLKTRNTKDGAKESESASITAQHLDALGLEEQDEVCTYVGEDGDQSAGADGDDFGFLGEASELRKVFSFKRRKIPFQTETGRRLREAYLNARSLFEEVETGHGDDDDALSDERKKAMLNLRRRILQVEDDDFKETRLELVQDLYARTFPSLALLFKSVWNCYAAEGVDGILPENCLEIAIDYIQMVLSLHNSVKSWKVKVDEDLVVVQPVKNKIIGPLKRVSHLLEQEKRQRDLTKANLEKQRSLAARAQRVEEKIARDVREGRERAALKRKWIDLHLERAACEPDPMLYRRLRCNSRIVLPNDPEPKIEEHDANGNPFERVNGLGAPRTSRPPSTKTRVAPEWTTEERSALDVALEKYSGPLVYQNVFRKLCRPGGVLRKYSVEDIVEQAIYMRGQYISWALEDGNQAEDWITNIPVFHWVEETETS